MLTPRQIKERVEKLGGKQGPLEIALVWNTIDDLDLMVKSATGDIIYFRNRRDSAGGTLDVDSNSISSEKESGAKPISNPAEHVRWQATNLKAGDYEVRVALSWRRTSGEIPYTVNINYAEAGLECTHIGNGSFASSLVPVYAGQPSPANTVFSKAELVQRFHFDPSSFSTSGGSEPSNSGLLRSALWTLFVGCTIGLALLAGQAIYLRQVPNALRLIRTAALSAGAGFLAGGVGELVFQTLSPSGSSQSANSVLIPLLSAWGTLGLLLGGSAAWIIPNLPPLRTALASLVGAVVAAGIADAFTGSLSEEWRAAVVAGLIGFAIGLTVVVAESVLRSAWAEVVFGPRERKLINLGAKPVTFGSSREATVYVSGTDPYSLVCRFDGKLKVRRGLQDGESDVRDGAKYSLGRVEITLHSSSEALGGAEPKLATSVPSVVPVGKQTSPPATSAASNYTSPPPTIPHALSLRVSKDGSIITLQPSQVVASFAGLFVIDLDRAAMSAQFENRSSQTWRLARPGSNPKFVQPGSRFTLMPDDVLWMGAQKVELVPASPGHISDSDADDGAGVDPTRFRT
jgi:hypothetical protein